MEDWLARDKKSVWHPFTQVSKNEDMLFVKEAKGIYLYDENGKKYIDGISSWWVNLFGHNKEEINSSIIKQVAQLEHTLFAGVTHQGAIEVAEKLIRLSYNIYDKVFFSDNGSTAVEVALKIGLQYFKNIGNQKRNKVMCLSGGYHGDTFGAMSIGEKGYFNKAFEEYFFETVTVPAPYQYNYQFVETEKFIKSYKDWDKVAVLIYEPKVQGSMGMKNYKDEILELLLSTAQKKGVLLIADEVFTGFGRTGKMFASEYYTPTPDIISLAKGITGGYMPMGITLCTQEIYQTFISDSPEHTLWHGHSYTANPLACAAANASLDLLLNYETLKDIIRIEKTHINQAKLMCDEQYPLKYIISNVRVIGTILAFEVKTPSHSDYFNNISYKLRTLFLEKGILLRPLGNTVYFMPPYCITNEELQTVYNIIESVISTLSK